MDKAIQKRLIGEARVIVEGGKSKPKDWSEHPFDSGPDFQEDFSHVVSNYDVAEADYGFSPDIYDYTYLSMELALPKRGEPDPQFARVTKLISDANSLPIVKSIDDPILDTRM